jgi:hypothetical protein
MSAGHQSRQGFATIPRAAMWTLTAARPEFPSILSPGVGDRLPLEVLHRVGTAAGERLNVILPVAGTSAAGFAGRGARMLALKLPSYLTGSVLSR